MGESDKTTIPDVIPHPAAALSAWAHHLSAALDPTSLTHLMIASVAAAAICWLPIEVDADGNRVPTVIFRGQPYAFQALVVLIVFGISTSYSALYSYGWPWLDRILKSCSVAFLSSAAAVVLYALCRGS